MDKADLARLATDLKQVDRALKRVFQTINDIDINNLPDIDNTKDDDSSTDSSNRPSKERMKEIIHPNKEVQELIESVREAKEEELEERRLEQMEADGVKIREAGHEVKIMGTTTGPNQEKFVILQDEDERAYLEHEELYFAAQSFTEDAVLQLTDDEIKKLEGKWERI